MVQLTTRDADRVSRAVLVSMSGIDLSPSERRIVRNARFPHLLRGILSAGTVLMVASFVAAIASTASGAGWMVLLAGGIFFTGVMVMFIGGAWLVRRWVGFNEGDIVARSWLRVGRCPACGFSIAGGRKGDDGATTCSECGARWHLPAAIR